VCTARRSPKDLWPNLTARNREAGFAGPAQEDRILAFADDRIFCVLGIPLPWCALLSVASLDEGYEHGFCWQPNRVLSPVLATIRQSPGGAIHQHEANVRISESDLTLRGRIGHRHISATVGKAISRPPEMFAKSMHLSTLGCFSTPHSWLPGAWTLCSCSGGTLP
jgi:hypothetical protein